MQSSPNRFAAALRDLSDRSSLRRIADACGIAVSELSRFRSGHKRISRVSVARLAATLPPEDGLPLVIAFLRDEVPEDYERFIDVALNVPTIRVEESQNPTRWQRAVQWVASQESNPFISDWLIHTAELFQSECSPGDGNNSENGDST